MSGLWRDLPRSKKWHTSFSYRKFVLLSLLFFQHQSVRKRRFFCAQEKKSSWPWEGERVLTTTFKNFFSPLCWAKLFWMGTLPGEGEKVTWRGYSVDILGRKNMCSWYILRMRTKTETKLAAWKVVGYGEQWNFLFFNFSHHFFSMKTRWKRWPRNKIFFFSSQEFKGKRSWGRIRTEEQVGKLVLRAVLKDSRKFSRPRF